MKKKKINVKRVKMNLRQFVTPFFFERKKGESDKTFSTKKFFAFMFAFFLGVINHLWLMFWPKSHWIVVLTKEGVSSASIGVIVGVIEVLIISAMTIYGYSKAKGAA